MSPQFLAFTLALTLAALTGLGAATPQMPVSEVRPGMVGIGRTVSTDTREELSHVMGVIEKVMGPQRNLILARLVGSGGTTG